MSVYDGDIWFLLFGTKECLLIQSQCSKYIQIPDHGIEGPPQSSSSLSSHHSLLFPRVGMHVYICASPLPSTVPPQELGEWEVANCSPISPKSNLYNDALLLSSL
jgi:hypothetical protein